MLRACRKLLVTGGRTAFLTIVPSPGLGPADHRRALRLGPRAVGVTRPLDILMEVAGFVEIDVVDATPAFVAVARAWEEEFSAHEGELRVLMGSDYDDRQSDRRDMIGALADGLLRRLLVSGTTPGESPSRR